MSLGNGFQVADTADDVSHKCKNPPNCHPPSKKKKNCRILSMETQLKVVLFGR